MKWTPIVLLALVVLAGCSIAGEPSEPTPTPTSQVVATYTTSGIPLEGLPINQTFQFRMGPTAPGSWEFPISVVFQRVVDGNWSETQVFNLDELEPVTVELLGKERYRILVEDANGGRRFVGIFVPSKPGADLTVVIGPCCRDKFDVTDSPGGGG